MLGIVVAIATLSFGAKSWRQCSRREEICRLLQPGPDAIIGAGREMLSRRSDYGHGDDPRRTDAIVLARESGLHHVSIPGTIREMNPRLVIISSNVVQIAGEQPRVNLLVFEKGVAEYGSVMITNGLWVWFGN